MATLGIDLGGTKIALGVLEGERLVYSRRIATPQDGAEHVLASMVEAARQALDGSGVKVDAIGIGTPGPIDYENGVVIFAPNIPHFRNVAISKYLAEHLGLPVFIENDANAAALAEHHLGAARGASSSLFVTVSTGIGSGIVLNGRVWRGAFGQAGELGHVTVLPGGPVCGCGNRGCLEALASGRALARDASYAFSEEVSTPRLFELWREGEEKARTLVEAAADYLGIALANTQKLLDPEVVVLGGGVTIGGGPEYLQMVISSFAAHTRDWRMAEVRLAAMGDKAGVVGAALAAQIS